MPSPQLQAYLAARQTRYAAEAVFLEQLETRANVSAEASALFALKQEQFRALRALLPPLIADRMLDKDSHVVLLEGHFVWLPLLAEEIGATTAAAEVAWALGQRPNGYPDEGIRCE
jgi:hypothetical protein